MLSLGSVFFIIPLIIFSGVTLYLITWIYRNIAKKENIIYSVGLLIIAFFFIVYLIFPRVGNTSLEIAFQILLVIWIIFLLSTATTYFTTWICKKIAENLNIVYNFGSLLIIIFSLFFCYYILPGFLISSWGGSDLGKITDLWSLTTGGILLVPFTVPPVIIASFFSTIIYLSIQKNLEKRIIFIPVSVALVYGIGIYLSFVPSISNFRPSFFYDIRIESKDASDITLYLPFPTYKGEPAEEILKMLQEEKENKIKKLEEELERDQKRLGKRRETLEEIWKRYQEDTGKTREELEEILKISRKDREKLKKYADRFGGDPMYSIFDAFMKLRIWNEMKFDLINTKYGKMLYIYMPSLPDSLFHIRPVVSKELKYTGIRSAVDRTAIRDFRVNPRFPGKDEEKIISNNYRGDIVTAQELSTAIYADFKGQLLDIEISYHMAAPFKEVRENLFWPFHRGPEPLADSLKYDICLDEQPCQIVECGWYFLPMVEKETKSIEE